MQTFSPPPTPDFETFEEQEAWLPWSIIETARAVGIHEIGLADAIADLALAHDFAKRFPDAGSFWDVHGTGGPDDVMERYPHPAWEASPLRLPTRYPRVSLSAGPVTYVDSATLSTWLGRNEPDLQVYAQRVRDAIDRGLAVVSWVEFRP
jgi:hypothetical protein